MNQFIKNKKLNELQQEMIESDEPVLNFMTDKESQDFVKNLIRIQDELINMPFVIGVMQGDKMVMHDVEISAEMVSAGIRFEVNHKYDNPEEEAFNEYSMRILTDKILVNRGGDDSYTLPRSKSNIVQRYGFGGSLVNGNVTFEMKDLTDDFKSKKTSSLKKKI